MAELGDMLRLAMIATLLALTAATDYSKVCKSEIHTMLKYKDKPAAACGKVLQDKCTEDDKRDILAEHNRLRKLVASGKISGQPAAVSMPNMVWDNEIATIAQRWAKQCDFGHDKCRNTETYVGQNVAIKMMKPGNVKSTELVKLWFDECKDFKDPKEISKFTGKDLYKVGHYTQLVWAKSTKLGCGCMKYEKDGWNTFYAVCNYGPGGNMLGQPIYQIKK